MDIGTPLADWCHNTTRLRAHQSFFPWACSSCLAHAPACCLESGGLYSPGIMFVLRSDEISTTHMAAMSSRAPVLVPSSSCLAHVPAYAWPMPLPMPVPSSSSSRPRPRPAWPNGADRFICLRGRGARPGSQHMYFPVRRQRSRERRCKNKICSKNANIILRRAKCRRGLSAFDNLV
jgi:hypothetical protein